MSKELALSGANTNAVALSDDDYFARLDNETASFKTGSGKPYLKFDGNNGEYTYGSDQIELPVGTQLVLNPRSYRRGYIIWVGGEVKDEVMRGIEEGPRVMERDLPDYGPYDEEDGPREQITVEFRMIEEPFVEMIFQANNKSKMRAIEALLKDFSKSYKMHRGCLPVIEIDSTEFEISDKKSKRKFKKNAPKFKIVDWIDQEELNAMAEGSPEDYPNGDDEVDTEEVITEAETDAEEAIVEEEEAAPAPQPARRTARKETTAPAKQAAPATKADTKPAAGARRGRFL